MTPAAKPRLTQRELVAKINAAGIVLQPGDQFYLVGIRGYYRDRMGTAGRNDRGIYDDAIFLVSPHTFQAFNANTDPSRVRAGRGTGAGKGMASLTKGLWRVHRFDLHKGRYLALCQRAGDVTVQRDGVPPYLDTGMFGINIHKGSNSTTSSEGCQTIPPAQWPAFIAAAQDQAKRVFGDRWRSTTIPYVLLDQ